MKERLTRDGYDRIGPFHPYLVWAGVALFDLIVVLALLAGFAKLGDKLEDAIDPGGEEWVTF